MHVSDALLSDYSLILNGIRALTDSCALFWCLDVVFVAYSGALY